MVSGARSPGSHGSTPCPDGFNGCAKLGRWLPISLTHRQSGYGLACLLACLLAFFLTACLAMGLHSAAGPWACFVGAVHARTFNNSFIKSFLEAVFASPYSFALPPPGAAPARPARLPTRGPSTHARDPSATVEPAIFFLSHAVPPVRIIGA